ncbi:hypothetical protein CEXT_445241 [Caerostris extrusa]|uniref:Uncharacterized protein n=1 Tax=Caerostris extrusa TaxID=172846 RepID=A0AAV4XFB1_CAEEX|nr:hypothetical protein CEXT_445241 [Caerostris extrusa]
MPQRPAREVVGIRTVSRAVDQRSVPLLVRVAFEWVRGPLHRPGMIGIDELHPPRRRVMPPACSSKNLPATQPLHPPSVRCPITVQQLIARRFLEKPEKQQNFLGACQDAKEHFPVNGGGGGREQTSTPTPPIHRGCIDWMVIPCPSTPFPRSAMDTLLGAEENGCRGGGGGGGQPLSVWE